MCPELNNSAIPLVLLSSSKCFAFRAKQSNMYLQCVHRKKEGDSRIEASAGTVAANARTRFLVENSEEHDGLVHLRCRYNNKYWVPVQDGAAGWLIGTADEPEDDLSDPSCTLFQAIDAGGEKDSVRFFHYGLRKHVCVLYIGDKHYLKLRDEGGDHENNNSDIFTVVSLPRQMELPKHVAFKGDNGMYLGRTAFGDLLATIQELRVSEYAILLGDLYPQFNAQDIGDPNVIFQIFTNEDGTVRIASREGWFWKRGSHDWIFLYGTPNPAPHINIPPLDDNDPDTLFEVVHTDGLVAFRNLGNKKFIKRLYDEKRDCLSACDDSPSVWARLKVEEQVLSREIYDIKFHLDEARIYNKEILKLVTEYSTNDTSKEMKATFSFVKKTEAVSKWETGASSKTGVGAKFNFGTGDKKPIIVGGEVAFSSETTSSEGQGESDSKTEETTVTREYVIPPRTTVAARLVGMRACSDVPYSYKRRDVVITTGEEVTSTHNDGIYTVANNYNFGVIFTDNVDEVKKLQASYY